MVVVVLTLLTASTVGMNCLRPTVEVLAAYKETE
jgi:hypothetical protein